MRVIGIHPDGERIIERVIDMPHAFRCAQKLELQGYKVILPKVDQHVKDWAKHVDESNSQQQRLPVLSDWMSRWEQYMEV